MSSISIFFPCYNDGATIANLIVEADRTARELTDDYEIIVIDDDSIDCSREILSELTSKYKHLKLIFHSQNLGYGAVLRTGFTHATKELVFYTDGDGQYDVKELKELYLAMNEEIDIVNGYKISRSDPLHRIIVGNIYLFLMKIFFGFKIKDVDCDFRMIRRSILEDLNLIHNSGVICLELVKKLENKGCRFIEIPVRHYFRAYGKSQFFNFRRLFRTGIEILILWRELNFNKKVSLK